MPILVIHIGDIHLQDAKDIVLTMAAKIADAIIAEIDPSVSGCILVNCGDSTQSGQAAQYVYAVQLLRSIKTKLYHRFGSDFPIHILVIPGNHDCDLSGDQTARDAMLGLPLESMMSPSVLPLILAPQKNYFEFTKNLVGEANSLTTVRPFYHSVDVEISNFRIRFHLLNSAWMSSRKEKMGTIRFPLAEIDPPTNPQANYAIALIHHPSHWFSQPDTMRPLRDRLESISEVVLTGHEHESLAFSKQTSTNDEHFYIEGGALQERGDEAVCAFNVIRLDFDKGLQTVTIYALTRDEYFWKSRGPFTRSISENRSRADRLYRLDRDFERYLDEIELPINHPQRDKIRLSEIFIYPDLRVFKDSSSEVLQRTRSDRVFETIKSHSRVLVTGSEKSGKTSLAKRLFADLHREGSAPILLDAAAVKSGTTSIQIRKLFGKSVKAQYDNLSPEQFEQLAVEKKILIVNNLQNMGADRAQKQEIFSYIKQQFSKVILIGDDEFCLEEIYGAGKGASVLSGYERFNICEFGFYLLEQLTKKWLSLSSGHQEDVLVVSEENIQRVIGLVEQVLRTNAIPHHPWVLIALLQNVDTAQGPAAKNGSYGHLLEAVITFALDGSKYKKIDIKGKYTLLSEYAFELYRQNEASLSEEDFAAFLEKYKDSYEIKFDQEKLCEDLLYIGLLRRDGGRLAFSSKYSYCFFVANYIARRIHEPDIRSIVRELSKRLHHEESANIIVFLAHLSSDPIVLEEMKKTAAELFQEYPLANFENDVEPINKLCHIDMRLSVSDSTPSQNRRLDQEAKDESLARRGSRSVERSRSEAEARSPSPGRRNFECCLLASVEDPGREAYYPDPRSGAEKRRIIDHGT